MNALTPSANPATGAVGRVIRYLTLLGLAVALGMLGLGAAVLFDARQDAWHQAALSSLNRTTAVERDITRMLLTYDQSLQGAIDALQQHGFDTVSPAMRQLALFDRARGADYFGSMVVLNAAGVIVDDPTSVEPHALDLSDRDYYQVHRRADDVGLYISRPFQNRLSNGEASVALSRRLPDVDGHFAGVVVGTIRLAYIQELFAKLDLGPRGSATLLRPDGVLLTRLAPDGVPIERVPIGAGVIQRFQAAPSGTYVATSMMDGIERFFVYKQVGALPLIVVLGLSVDDVYAGWWRKAMSIGSILVILCGALVALCVLFRQEMLRRLGAERALVEAADRLSVIAATDELTGLANRRAFEADLAIEWRRAARAGTPLALLMIDADFFKAFNDHYGHPAGDTALVRIAHCIGSTIRRPGDFGARYGGEEFVALLPDTEQAGAVNTAERICAALAGLAIPHEASSLGRVTISIGVAIAYPGGPDSSGDLLRRADEALYEAKRSGRARVCMAASMPAPAISIPVLGSTLP